MLWFVPLHFGLADRATKADDRDGMMLPDYSRGRLFEGYNVVCRCMKQYQVANIPWEGNIELCQPRIVSFKKKKKGLWNQSVERYIIWFVMFS